MKQLRLLYLEECPYCKEAFAFIDQLKQEDDRYKDIEIETIEESVHPELIVKYNFYYYYVPTIYMDDVKMHEGIITKEDVKRIFDKALEE
ncbi:MAG: thioredoxin family protein [Tannerella sp.]|jgi:thiol-disulfide isomerase/thioredoxin|nr:thioredoxin family protein [Tannerella sp.]